jgi:hypothetical protein
MNEPLITAAPASGLSDSNAGLGGMTLLDYFAAKAISGILTMPAEEWEFDFSDARGEETTYSDHIAMAAYSIGEAMLRARRHERFVTPNDGGKRVDD